MEIIIACLCFFVIATIVANNSMRKYGINYANGKYVYDGCRYGSLFDAVSHAKRQAKKIDVAEPASRPAR